MKPEFWRSLTLARVPRDARLLFIGLWNFADDHGRGVAEPRLIKGDIFPLDDDVTLADVSRWLEELASIRVLILYNDDLGRRLYQVRSWNEHQKIDRKGKSLLPEHIELFDEVSSSPQRAPAEDSSPEGKGEEQGAGKGKEEERSARGVIAERTERDLFEGLKPHPEALVILDGWLKATGNRFALVTSIRKFGPGGIQEAGSWADVASAMVDFAASSRGNLAKPNALGIFVATAKRNRLKKGDDDSAAGAVASQPKPPVAPLAQANLDPSAASRRPRV